MSNCVERVGEGRLRTGTALTDGAPDRAPIEPTKELRPTPVLTHSLIVNRTGTWRTGSRRVATTRRTRTGAIGRPVSASPRCVEKRNFKAFARFGGFISSSSFWSV